MAFVRPTAQRSSRRARLVAELERYTNAGVFPLNESSPDRAMPAFIDAHGTRCAMAFLIERHGGERLVERVAANDNHGFVRALAVDSDLRAWLDAWDLTIDEAARIQPGYCWTAAHCTCVNVGGAQTVIEVKDGRVVKVHGKQDKDTEVVGALLSRGRSEPGEFLVVPYKVGTGDKAERRLEWKRVEDGTVTCEVIDRGVKKEHAIRAVLSARCEQTLEAFDPKYTKDCRPFRRHAMNVGGPLGLAATALGAVIWVRRRRERA